MANNKPPTWSVRPLGRNQFEIVRGKKIAVLVSCDEPCPRPATMVRRFAEILARSTGEPLDPRTAASAAAIDWRSMGWQSRGEHDEFRALVGQARNAWNDSPLAGRCDEYFYRELDRLGINRQGPHTLAEMNEIYETALRTPQIVCQDVDAERGAA